MLSHDVSMHVASDDVCAHIMHKLWIWLSCHTMHVHSDENHFIFPTDLTLTTDRLTELFQSVRDPDNPGQRLRRIRVLVRNLSIGEMLSLPESVLEEIKRDYLSMAKRKEAYLDTYTHHHPCPSWKKISEVLRRCDLYLEADEVENIYVQGMHVHVHL